MEKKHPVLIGNGLIALSTFSHHDDHKPNTIYYYIRMSYRGGRDASVYLDRCMSYKTLSKLMYPEFCINDLLDEMLEQLTESKGEEKMANNNDKFLKTAKAAVVCWYNQRNAPSVITMDDVYIVWFSKTLQNWKALASTSYTDGMYYEITYDGNKEVAYVDAYKKWDNAVMTHGLLEKVVNIK